MTRAGEREIGAVSGRFGMYGVIQRFVPIVTYILRKAFNASLGKCKLFQVTNLSK